MFIYNLFPKLWRWYLDSLVKKKVFKVWISTLVTPYIHVEHAMWSVQCSLSLLQALTCLPVRKEEEIYSLLGSAGTEMIWVQGHEIFAFQPHQNTDLDSMYSVSTDLGRQPLQTQNIERFHTTAWSNRKRVWNHSSDFPRLSLSIYIRPVEWHYDKAAQCICLRGDSEWRL